MKIAFAGLDHIHSFDFYNKILKEEPQNIVGLWEPYEQTKDILKGKGIFVTYNSYDDMLMNSGADIIAIGSWFTLRGELIIKALNAGKHVFVDKPICTSTTELNEIEQIIKEKNLKLGSMLNMRYFGKVIAIRNLIMSGGIGDIKTIYYGQQHPLFYKTRPRWYFEEGKHGGVITDIAIHGIDLIRFITGLRPRKVLSARCWNAFATDTPVFEDCAQFMVELSNGAGLLSDVSYSIPDGIGYEFPTHWEIFGTKGAIRFSLQNRPTEVYYDNQKEPKILEPQPITNNYWTDFINEIEGNSDCIITTEEIIMSTRDTLMIQEYSDR